MKIAQRTTVRAGMALTSLVTVGAVLINAMPVHAAPFADPSFERVWTRTDSLVADGKVSRTWFWGPQPLDAAQEQYIDAPDGSGTRKVQYFDKSRMEINNPGADKGSPFYVTNGLLTIELISGQMQIGNNAFVNRYPAEIPISGDIDDTNAPTYASFIGVSNTRRGDHPQQDMTGKPAIFTINKAGQVGQDPSKANVPGSTIAYYEPTTKHNIPNIFWQFLNASGPITDSGQVTMSRLIDPWFYASGLPISDPYWTKVKINGVANVDVMIQAYERRVLTYVPTNVPGFQVEMGNIGIHYRDWRYKDAGKPSVTPTVTGTPPTATSTVVASATGTPPTATGTTTATGTATTIAPTVTGTPPTATPTITATPNPVSQGVIIFSTDRTGNREIFRIKGDGTALNPANLSNNPAADDYPAVSPDNRKIAFASKRDGDHWQIYVMNWDGSGQTRLTSSAGNDFQPAWSPDGTQIAFTSDRSGKNDIWVMNANGTGAHNLTLTAGIFGDNRDPSWGANHRIAFTSNKSGGYQIWTVDEAGSPASALQLTTQGDNNRQPKWNTLGNRLAFVSNRDGNDEIYTMRPGGEEQFRLTNNTAADREPSYAPDNSLIVFSSDRVGSANFELYTMKVDGTSQDKITIQDGFDGRPSWGLQP